MANYIETNEMAFDELIGGTSITPLLFIRKVTAAGAGTIKKGTLLSEGADGKFTVTSIYVRGIFNQEKLIAAADDTVAAHEAELRKVGIYMTSLK